MKDLVIHIPVRVWQWEELAEEDRHLLMSAREATSTSYSPYSHFSVGAAVLLDNGEIVSGSNQENAAYPSGTCAERCAMFYANARYPQVAPKAIAIAARGTDGAFLASPISPCGACRQVLIETQRRYGRPLRVLLYGSEGTFELESVEHLLPLTFTGDALGV